ncbi:hypothetical protein WJ45_20000 [Burkholderia ubonensis]|nr:hypothetical protein WJ45_20000 [Burkholderia ubonensis]KVQ44337.1 hypothetical protein WK04_15505 [Burkholderia ubonensis]
MRLCPEIAFEEFTVSVSRSGELVGAAQPILQTQLGSGVFGRCASDLMIDLGVKARGMFQEILALLWGHPILYEKALWAKP